MRQSRTTKNDTRQRAFDREEHTIGVCSTREKFPDLTETVREDLFLKPIGLHEVTGLIKVVRRVPRDLPSIKAVIEQRLECDNHQ